MRKEKTVQNVNGLYSIQDILFPKFQPSKINPMLELFRIWQRGRKGIDAVDAYFFFRVRCSIKSNSKGDFRKYGGADISVNALLLHIQNKHDI